MRIAHLSDLHFGHHDENLAAGLAEDLSGQAPDLVVVSGDFTQRGTPREFAAARAFLDTLAQPVFCVPGNHDVPQRNLWRRFTDPYRDYRRYIAADPEPFLLLDGVALAGIKTSRRARLSLDWSDGTVGKAQLALTEKRFSEVPADSVRIVVAHHPLMMPLETMNHRQDLAKRADLALATFARIGVRLVLSGHFHMSYVRRHEHPGTVAVAAPTGVRTAAHAPILVAQASSTISTRLRGHLNAYNLIDIESPRIAVTVREWRETRWVTREKASEMA